MGSDNKWEREDLQRRIEFYSLTSYYYETREPIPNIWQID